MMLRTWLATQVGRTVTAAGAGLFMLAAAALISVLSAAPSDAAIEQHRALLIAKEARGDFSQGGLDALLRRMASADAAVAERYDPAQFKASAAVIPPAKLDLDMVRLLPGLSAQQALAVNAGLPRSGDPNPSARPFSLKGASAQDRLRAEGCLTQAVYYEAGFEPLEGAQAVAQVVLNRVRHPAFPKTVCGVVFEGASLKTGCQFSFTCDGSLGRPPAPAAWKRAQEIAQRALNGFVVSEVGGATHYHTQWVVPYWAPTLAKVDQIGAHLFYRWPGDWGLPAAFRGRYAGGEAPGADVGGDPLAALGEPAPAPAPETSRIGLLLDHDAPADAPKAAPVVVAAVGPAEPLTAAPSLEATIAPDGPAPITFESEPAPRRSRAAFSSSLH